MTFEELVDIAADLHCFSAGMVTAGEDVNVVRVNLSRWVANGRLIRIRKGWYTLREPFRRVRLNLYVIACMIKRGTYVSLQSALEQHGMIPEYVAETTCVTTGRPLIIASTEKALLDLFYLTPGSEDAAYIRKLRLQSGEELDMEKMATVAHRYRAPRLLRAVERLDQYLNLVEGKDAK